MITRPSAERKYAVTLVALSAFALLAAAGCSGGRRSPVAGKVTYQGEVVSGGSLTFVPQGPGKPATAKIQSDGRFNAGTNEEGDGIKPGTYSIFCTPHLAMGMKMELIIQ